MPSARRMLSAHMARQHSATNRAGIMDFANVLLQIEVPAKAFKAHGASVRFLFVVGVHVECQIVDLMECLVANVAFVRFFAAVGELMVFVIALLMETYSR